MNRLEKEALVQSVASELGDANLVIIAHQKGLSVSRSTQLRALMRQGGACFKVVKNTLLDIAVEGTKWEGLRPFLNGPTVISYSKDPIAAAKILISFIDKSEEISVITGCLDGKILSAAEVKALALLPSLDELRSTIIGVITAPAAKIARIVLEPAAQLARVCGAYGNTN
jgi:large subunit ribosomal protein L10